eukprot:TRINITY_DN34445_c0_g1_i2.p1 TRINITY_DN34445_c0_g1~~TRINITY_DN34445_c0_g1_i2.p1  ORF type:complete len:258 (+),score=38.13 TRINITY_DN34445_c0_g1_i2:126-899(+)
MRSQFAFYLQCVLSLSVASAGHGDVCEETHIHATSNLLAQLQDRSYLVFRRVLPEEKLSRALTALKRHIGTQPGTAQRIEELLELDPVFAELVAELPPEVVAIADAMLSPAWQLGSFHAHVIHPQGRVLNDTDRDSKEMQAMHSDFPYGHATREFGGSLQSVPKSFPHTLQLIWMLSPFTAEGGATRILPGSHRDRELVANRSDPKAYSRFKSDAAVITGEAGDLVCYIGQAWHIWGVNEGEQKRIALLGQVVGLCC